MCQCKIVTYSLSAIQTIFDIETLLGQLNPVWLRRTAAVLLENLVNYAKSLDLDYPRVKVGASPFNLVIRYAA